MSPSAHFSFENVSFFYPNGVQALQDIQLKVEPGEFVSILGPSGCGKTTFLRLLAGLELPSRGSIQKPDNLKISYVFQDAHLLPWRTALENVMLPLEFISLSKDEARAKAKSCLKNVGLEDFIGAYPSELSGGMRMRVSLARALVREPQLLLMDEPFAALDELIRNQLDLELFQLWKQQKPTIIFVTHSVSEAVFLSERFLVLSKRPGKILADQKMTLGPDRTEKTRLDSNYLLQVQNCTEALKQSFELRNLE